MAHDDGDQPLGTVQLPASLGKTAAPIAQTVVAGVVTAAGAPPEMDVPPVLATVMPDAGYVPPGAPPELPPWRYELRVEIARGGMGRVVEAQDTVLGRTVALKEALSHDPDSIRRFERETRITARLEHPSIVPVHDAGTSPSGAPFYVMRKIGGRPLEELVGRSPELADRLALLPHMVAAANAIAHAHARGIVHRDVKPSNILVGELGETMLIDWGLAKALGEPDPDAAPNDAPSEAVTAPLSPPGASASLSRVYDDDDDILKTRAGVVFGTPGFLAPEQLRGAPPDERCDVYALGATLYHLLARRPPHYSKNAADMMRLALEGPPEPLRDRAPGVPRELATIVDKALAHDRDARYRDARSLADDLQRFISGQLVASHHYSTRERVVRWVRQNRTSVGIAAAAFVAAAVFGVFALSRIVAARDEEHDARVKEQAEHARFLAASKGEHDQLVAYKRQTARGLVETDATRAIATLADAYEPTGWRETRAIAANARAAGVAYAMPGSRSTASLELSRDGLRALAAGDDGVVRIYDLAKHTAPLQIADERAPVKARFGDAEHTVAIYRGDHLALVDVASGKRRDLTTPTPIEELGIAGPIAYWRDPERALWKLDLAGGAPERVVTEEPIGHVYPSPDGRFVALAGAAHFYVIDRAQGGQVSPQLFGGSVRDLMWDGDGMHAAMLTDSGDLIAVDLLEDGLHVVHRFVAGGRDAIAWTPGGLFLAGKAGVTPARRETARLDEQDPDATQPRVAAGDVKLGLHLAWGGSLIAGRPTKLSLISDDGDHTIDSPLPLQLVATSPRGPYVAAAADGRVLVWDLSALLPQRVATGDVVPSGVGFVTADQVVASLGDGPGQWLDLRAGKSTPLGDLSALVRLAPAPNGQRAIAIDVAHRATLLAPIGGPVDLGDADHAGFVDDRRFALALAGGTIALGEGSGAPAPLVARDAHPVALAVRPAAEPGADPRIAAAFDDRTIWRAALPPTGGPRDVATLQVARAPAAHALALGPGGEVVIGANTDLIAWRADGTQTKLWTGANQIVFVELVDATHVIAIEHGGRTVIASTAAPGDVYTLPLELAQVSISHPDASGAALVALVTTSGALDLLDPVSHDYWTLAPRAAGTSYEHVELSADARRVIAIAGGGLRLWTLNLPATADATPPWLAGLTDAALPPVTGAPLLWK